MTSIDLQPLPLPKDSSSPTRSHDRSSTLQNDNGDYEVYSEHGQMQDPTTPMPDHYSPETLQTTLPEVKRSRLKDFQNRFMTFEYAVLLNIGGVIGSGIYGTLPDIYRDTGSVGMSIVLWIVGAIVAMTGVSVYVEQATRMPRSGGEKQYLSSEYPSPPFLMSTIFSISLVVLIRPGGCSADAFLASSNIFSAFIPDGQTPNQWHVNLVATAMLVVIGTFFMLFERQASLAINIITIFKILCLLFIIVVGWVDAGAPLDGGKSAAQINFIDESIWSGTRTGVGAFYNVAVALYKIDFALEGWNFLLYSTNQLTIPSRNIARASWTAVLITSGLYILVIVSFFLVVPKEVIALGDTVFIRRYLLNISFLPNSAANWLAPLFVVVSTIGSIACQTFVASTIIFETASDGLLPFSHTLVRQRQNQSKHFATLWHTCFAVLYVWVLGSTTNYNSAYYFIVNAASYSTSLFYLLSAIGLYLYIRRIRQNTEKSAVAEDKVYHSWHLTKVIFILGCVWVLVAPFFPPASDNGSPDAALQPYWLFPVLALAICGVAFLWYIYWVWYLHKPSDSPAIRAYRKYFPDQVERITTRTRAEEDYDIGDVQLPTPEPEYALGVTTGEERPPSIVPGHDDSHYDMLRASARAAGAISQYPRRRRNRALPDEGNSVADSQLFDSEPSQPIRHGTWGFSDLARIQEVHEEFARGAMFLNASHGRNDVEQGGMMSMFSAYLPRQWGRTTAQSHHSNPSSLDVEELHASRPIKQMSPRPHIYTHDTMEQLQGHSTGTQGNTQRVLIREIRDDNSSEHEDLS